jgi:hypothetical protein
MIVEEMTKEKDGYQIHGPMIQTLEKIVYIRGDLYLLEKYCYKLEVSDNEDIKKLIQTIFIARISR